MRTRLTLLALCLLASIGAFAQTVTLTGTKFKNIDKSLIKSGKFNFEPVNNRGEALNYRDGGGGQTSKLAKYCTIVNGAIVGTCTLPDTSQTTPVNSCVHGWVTDTSGNELIGRRNVNASRPSGYDCIQTAQNNDWCTNGVCNIDNYVPAVQAGVVQVSGPTGPQGPIGPIGPQGQAALMGASRGSYSSGTAYAVGDVVAYNGQSYASLVAGNTGNQPDTSPTKWGSLVSLNNLPTAFAAQSQANPQPIYASSVAAGTTTLDGNGVTGEIGKNTAKPGHFSTVDAQTYTGDGTALAGSDFFYLSGHYRGVRAVMANRSYLVGSTAPVQIVLVGDSIPGFYTESLHWAASRYQRINSLGWVGFGNNSYANTGAATVTLSSGWTTTVRDTTSAAAWGISGSRIDGAAGQTVTFTTSSKYPFNAFRLWYNKTTGGGAFTYSIDGGAATSVDTSNTVDALGYVTATGLDGRQTHTISIAVTSGNVRLYGADIWNVSQPGVILHVLQQAGSQAAEWNGHTAYTAQFVATVAPIGAIVWLGTNDIGATRTAEQFGADVQGIITGLSLPATTAPVVMTNLRKGLNTDSTQDDWYFAQQVGEYRTKLLSLAAANDWAMFDTFNYWPDYATAYALGMYSSDYLHPSNAGAFYIYSGLTRALFSTIADPITEQNTAYRRSDTLFAPDGSAGIGSFFLGGVGGARQSTGTGFYWPDTQSTLFKQLGSPYWISGDSSNVGTLINGVGKSIFTVYPTTANPSVLQSARRSSTTAAAWRLTADNDDFNLVTNNGDLVYSSNGTERLRVSSGAGSAGKAVCWKTATKIGYCSTVPDATGSCTCN
jgi:lysophospholipase L1-like esterase